MNKAAIEKLINQARDIATKYTGGKKVLPWRFIVKYKGDYFTEDGNKIDLFQTNNPNYTNWILYLMPEESCYDMESRARYITELIKKQRDDTEEYRVASYKAVETIRQACPSLHGRIYYEPTDEEIDMNGTTFEEYFSDGGHEPENYWG